MGRVAAGGGGASLQVYIHGLRKQLGSDRIETHGGGYRLRLEPDELDLERFEHAWNAAAAHSTRASDAGAAES